jgi:hypothetical protein
MILERGLGVRNGTRVIYKEFADEEITMRSDLRRRVICAAACLVCWLVTGGAALAQAQARAQHGDGDAPTSPARTEESKALSDLVRELQAQVKDLNARVQTLESNQRNAQAETQSLREELAATKGQPGHSTETYGRGTYAAPSKAPSDAAQTSLHAASAPENAGESQSSVEDRLTRLEEDAELTNAKVQEQSQTKVESSSKYRLRISGLALFNLFGNSGTVDNEDIPQIATPPATLSSGGTFGGSLRQTQIGLEGFGPDIAGAHVSAEVRFDFAGGFPQAPNGNNMGLVRLRTGTVRFDWGDTSVVAGQDYLFFSPLAPTSYASLAIPALSYSGNLWGWTPQLRVEHRIHLTDESAVTVTGGILQTLSANYFDSNYTRVPTPGESSGQPAYAARIAWSRGPVGHNIVAGVGGYYGRQNWGFNRNVDGWVATADLNVPLGQYIEFAGQFYRGRAVGGLGGGIGQSVLWNDTLSNPATEVYGLNSMGGWLQMKVKPSAKLEINGAFGEDSPFASDLRQFENNPIYANGLLSKNLTPLVNFIYRPRSNVVFSLEYRHLKTFTVDSTANSADHINLSVGYIF